MQREITIVDPSSLMVAVIPPVKLMDEICECGWKAAPPSISYFPHQQAVSLFRRQNSKLDRFF